MTYREFVIRHGEEHKAKSKSIHNYNSLIAVFSIFIFTVLSCVKLFISDQIPSLWWFAFVAMGVFIFVGFVFITWIAIDDVLRMREYRKRSKRLAEIYNNLNIQALPSNVLINEEKDLKLELFRCINEGRMHIECEKIRMTENGLEYVTPIGKIDLLTQSDNTTYVIELKDEKRTADKVVGQVMRYAGYMKEHGNKTRVVPVIIARNINSKLLAACNASKNIVLYQHFQFVGSKEIVIQKVKDVSQLLIENKTNYYTSVRKGKIKESPKVIDKAGRIKKYTKSTLYQLKGNIRARYSRLNKAIANNVNPETIARQKSAIAELEAQLKNLTSK